MVKIRIIKNVIVNVSDQKEATQGDIRDVSNVIARHLVDDLKVAEYVDAMTKPEKQTKTAKKSVKTLVDNENA